VVIWILFDIYRMYIIRSLSKLFDKKKNHQEISTKYTNVVFALSPKANRFDLTETYTVSLYFMVYFQTYHFNCRVVFYCVIFFSCLLLMSSNQKIIWLCGSGFIYIHVHYFYTTPHHLSVWHQEKTCFCYSLSGKTYSPTAHNMSHLYIHFFSAIFNAIRRKMFDNIKINVNKW